MALSWEFKINMPLVIKEISFACFFHSALYVAIHISFQLQRAGVNSLEHWSAVDKLENSIQT